MNADAGFSQNMIQKIQDNLESASPQEILRHAVNHFGDAAIVVTSFQISGIVTLHMLQNILPSIRVYTLDTGLLFPESYALMDKLESLWNLNLIRVRPQLTVTQQAEQYGANLWEHEPNQCCNMRKIIPLKNVLTDCSAWITGLRRDQSPQRANTPVISWDARNERVKYAPFATWTEDMLWTYIHAYDLPYNELHNHSYPSIGCYPCTQPVHEGNDIRAGRWTNHAKTECGIHFSQ